MTSRLSIVLQTCALLALLSAPCALAQTTPASEPDAVPITRVIAGTANKTGKKFLVDPRVKSDVTLIGLDADRLDYPTLLSVLQVHGYAAIDDGKFVRVVPDAIARQLPMPVIAGDGSHAGPEYVTRVLRVKSVSSAHLVPVLRPLLPQQAHLVALPCKNMLVLVDTFANVQRLEKIVTALDVGEPFQPEKCGPPAPPKAD